MLFRIHVAQNVILFQAVQLMDDTNVVVELCFPDSAPCTPPIVLTPGGTFQAELFVNNTKKWEKVGRASHTPPTPFLSLVSFYPPLHLTFEQQACRCSFFDGQLPSKNLEAPLTSNNGQPHFHLKTICASAGMGKLHAIPVMQCVLWHHRFFAS